MHVYEKRIKKNTIKVKINCTISIRLFSIQAIEPKAIAVAIQRMFYAITQTKLNRCSSSCVLVFENKINKNVYFRFDDGWCDFKEGE